MKRELLLAFLSLFFSIPSWGQSLDLNVTAADGGLGQSESSQLSWTLGETFIEHESKAAVSLSMGFQQSWLHQKSSNFLQVRIANKDLLTLNAYPNPTTGIITVEVPNGLSPPPTLRLTDLHGKLLIESLSNPSQASTDLDLSRLPDGVYLLRLHGLAESSYQTVKIHKH